MIVKKGNFWALLPLIIFILVYFSASTYLNDFYSVPALVVFMLALVIAFVQFPKISFNTKAEAFCKNAGEETIVLMILIFLLAGAFGSLGSTIGAVESTVNLFLNYLPASFIVSGFFLLSCFISTALGTSVGTIVTVAPIAVQMDKMIPGSMPILLGAVVGGAMFGDNLSFISDTTIAATRTQEVSMKSKFKTNFRIVVPAAIVSAIIYFSLSQHFDTTNFQGKQLDFDLILVLPYLLVFGIAMSGINVIWALIVGILSFLGIGLFYSGVPMLELVSSINEGFKGMFELSIICLVIGGIVGIIRLNGGLDFIIYHLTKNIKTKRQAEISIASLTALANACLANNTITILICGKIAKDISDHHDLEGKRVASILDTVSCFVQGILPYGAQVLAAVAAANAVSSVTKVSSIDVLSNLYYPFLTGICTLIFILFFQPKSSKK
ncbi:Na+/H+ antiporter NhaC family protein [Empedobacter brevis]|uniref:Na+/H+ antiporter NhaC family protein n=1 Tax=Empedobacter brevis TaxID=247 RepID=A0AAJ1VBR7_9FLAO|nr:Na+/H+ antiporter NhaC family protein [Empedobacter brevis]MDM1074255.1 Na+/H+ antiporter NhaC family protein [Empedobacter brevis]QES91385.1 Na+/H+ antiporter NhaC family protein [Empedobacter brevis]QHC86435.1 sodium:proton antiporter [Empedobacter brevis]